MGPGVSFALDRYQPVAFHTHPELMRAAEAPTAVLTPVPAVVPPPVPPPVVPASTPPTPAPAPPTEPIAAYLIGMNATATLRAGLADFLDAAGARRDVRVSVGVATGGGVAWVLRDQVPFDVRALPRYPAVAPPVELAAVLTLVAGAVAEDAAAEPQRRQLLVLLWDRTPAPVDRPPALAAAVVVHAVDAVLAPEPSLGATGAWLLARSRTGPSPSLLAHAGRLLDRWETFAVPPRGLTLSPARGGDPLEPPTSIQGSVSPARVGRPAASRCARPRPGTPGRPPARPAPGPGSR